MASPSSCTSTRASTLSHFHARYAGVAASIDFDGNLIAGKLPPAGARRCQLRPAGVARGARTALGSCVAPRGPLGGQKLGVATQVERPAVAGVDALAKALPTVEV